MALTMLSSTDPFPRVFDEKFYGTMVMAVFTNTMAKLSFPKILPTQSELATESPLGRREMKIDKSLLQNSPGQIAAPHHSL
ncbi:MAG TPA: hypothetical protein PLJ14_06865, partial [Accumulibacter sp.]|nr:hypothetical protein [Accumulibacter sp.]HNE12868.1 hypothetical protein [Accumulibacter sp.]HNI72692.1 hypothetical protein [Accumulibacter sp.]HNK00338.1 hypothetical protein [Accumulibacter sp.]